MNETVSTPLFLMLLRKYFARLWLTLRYRVFDRRYRRLVIEYVDNVPLIVLPDVFNPVLFRTGEFLARTLHQFPLLNVDDGHAPLVLDLGSGSGIGAVFAAHRGAQVVGVDLNPEAVRCIKLNALLNHFEDKIEARLGDLFEQVKDERFDLVLFNPPFYKGPPKDNLDMAWRGEEIFERFAANLKSHLTASGQALMVLSTHGDPQAALAELETHDFIVRTIRQRDFGNEIITIYQISTL